MVALPTTTPMHKAAIGGDIDTVLALLQEGTPTCIKIVFPSYEKGVTALHLAARSGRVEVVKALLGAGACVNGAVESCMTSMTCADPTPLQEAAYEGHVNVTRALLAAGAAWALRTAGNRVNWRHRYGEDKYAAIHFAAYENHSRVVRALVQAGADVNQRSERYGFAPIHIASWRGYVGVITMLIRLGADVQIADYIFGSSPLSRTSSLEAVETLLAAGSNPNWFAKSDDQIEHTPIAYQVMRLSDTSSQKDVERSRAISEALLREGADPNIRAPVQGIPITLLAYASMSGLPSMVSLFLDAGLDPDEVIEHWCMSSLHLAAMGGHAEVLRVLLSAGANKNIRNKKGSTPLHTACTFGQMICVHTLLQWKCDPTAVEDGPDGSGYTPADLLTFPQHWSPGGGRLCVRLVMVPNRVPRILLVLRNGIDTMRTGQLQPLVPVITDVVHTHCLLCIVHLIYISIFLCRECQANAVFLFGPSIWFSASLRRRPRK